jgi:hypothetical protein
MPIYTLVMWRPSFKNVDQWYVVQKAEDDSGTNAETYLITKGSLFVNHDPGFTHYRVAGTVLLDSGLVRSTWTDWTAGALDHARGYVIIADASGWVGLAIGAADTVLKSDGTDPAWGNVGHDELTDIAADDHHDPVTLHADLAANLLELSTQAIDLDTQDKALVFASDPTTDAQKPSFRALVPSDIPTLPATKVGGHTHVINEDLTGLADGARTVFGLANEAQPETTALFKNGTRMRLDDDYTETDLYNSVTFGVAPGAADDVWIDYIPVG